MEHLFGGKGCLEESAVTYCAVKFGRSHRFSDSLKLAGRLDSASLADTSNFLTPAIWVAKLFVETCCVEISAMGTRNALRRERTTVGGLPACRKFVWELRDGELGCDNRQVGGSQ